MATRIQPFYKPSAPLMISKPTAPTPPLRPSSSRTTSRYSPYLVTRPSRTFTPKPESERAESPRPSGFSDASDTSDLSDLSECPSEVYTVKLIPKPEGDCGRPKSGGYNLAEALNWNPRDFKQLQKSVQYLANQHLDTVVSYSKQSSGSLAKVRNTVTEEFPRLREYEDFWPVNDCLKVYLKRTTALARVAKKEAHVKSHVEKGKKRCL